MTTIGDVREKKTKTDQRWLSRRIAHGISIYNKDDSFFGGLYFCFFMDFR